MECFIRDGSVVNSLHSPKLDDGRGVRSTDRFRLALVASPFAFLGGASQRSEFVLPYLAREFNVTLLLPQIAIDGLIALDRRDFALTKLQEYSGWGVSIPAETLHRLEYPFLVDKPRSPIRFLSESREREIARAYIDYVRDADLIYSHHEAYEAVYLARELARGLTHESVGVAVLLQLQPFYSNPLSELVSLSRYLGPAEALTLLGRLDRRFAARTLYRAMLGDRVLKLLLSTSTVPLRLSGLDKVNVNRVVLRPAACLSQGFTQDRPPKVDAPYALWYSRLTPEKGIYELIDVWEIVHRVFPSIQLVVAGRYEDRLTERRVRRVLIARGLDRSVRFEGFLSTQALRALISGASVHIYPAHEDSFGLVIMESLSLGTPVVAFNTPAVGEIYGGTPGVNTVPDFAIEAMALEVIRILGTSEEKMTAVMNSEETRRLVAAHSSVEAVAQAEVTAISDYLVSRKTVRT